MSETQHPRPGRDLLLAGRSFDGLEFVDLDIQGLDLGEKEFTSCSFRHCKAQEVQWRGSRLDDCRFERCDLTRTQIRGMLAHDLRFTDCKLMGVEWAELGRFPQLAFTACVLDYASFVALPLRNTAYINCKIGEANFFDVDLREADFAGSDLRGSVFRGCKLGKADFSAATGVYFDPAVNDARGAMIPVETAVLMAMQAGLQVAGFTAPDGPAWATKPAAPRGGRTRR